MLPDAEFFLMDPTEDKAASSSPETRHLTGLIAEFATKSRAKDTFKKYRTPWRRWICWATLRSRKGEATPALPANPFHVALFLAHLSEEYPDAVTVVGSAKTAINFAHKFNGLPEPHGAMAQAVTEGVRRTRGRPTVKAKPLTRSMVRKIQRNWGGEEHSLWKHMMSTMVSLGFHAWCRFGELEALKRSDVVIKNDHMRIFIEKSKTDQCRKGAWVLIAKSGGKFCPVDLMARFLRRTQEAGRTALFPTIWRRSRKRTGDLMLGIRAISSTTYHKYFRRALRKLVGLSAEEALKYSGHSLRRGGATAAALVQLPTHLRMSHGRWVDQRAADGYIGVPFQTALQVTQKMGL